MVIRRLAFYLAIFLAVFAICQPDAFCKSASAKNGPTRKWTVQDTIKAAIAYSPVVKREEEAVMVQRENVNYAKSGHLPRVDVEASGGAATLPVSKYD